MPSSWLIKITWWDDNSFPSLSMTTMWSPGLSTLKRKYVLIQWHDENWLLKPWWELFHFYFHFKTINIHIFRVIFIRNVKVYCFACSLLWVPFIRRLRNCVPLLSWKKKKTESNKVNQLYFTVFLYDCTSCVMQLPFAMSAWPLSFHFFQLKKKILRPVSYFYLFIPFSRVWMCIKNWTIINYIHINYIDIMNDEPK